MARKKTIKSDETKKKVNSSPSQFSLIQKELMKKYGERNVVNVDNKDIYNSVFDGDIYIPTGSPTLDFALDVEGRGLRGGEWLGISGKENTGKTSVLSSIAANAQKYQDYKVVAIDFENRSRLKKYQSYGINISPDKFQLIQPDSGEQGIIAIMKFLSLGEKIFLIVDSMDAIQFADLHATDWEGAREDKGRNMIHAKRNKSLTEFFNQANPLVRKTNCIFGYVQQLRMKGIGGHISYQGENSPGNLDYYGDHKIRIRTLDKTDDIKFSGKVYGRFLEFRFIKNESNSPGIRVKIPFIYMRGFWREMDIVQLGLKNKILKTEGKNIVFQNEEGEELLSRSSDKNFASYMTKNPDDESIKLLEKQVLQACYDKDFSELMS